MSAYKLVLTGWIGGLNACVRLMGVCSRKRPVSAIYRRVIGMASGCDTRVATSLDLFLISVFSWFLISADRSRVCCLQAVRYCSTVSRVVQCSHIGESVWAKHAK